MSRADGGRVSQYSAGWSSALQLVMQAARAAGRQAQSCIRDEKRHAKSQLPPCTHRHDTGTCIGCWVQRLTPQLHLTAL